MPWHAGQRSTEGCIVVVAVTLPGVASDASDSRSSAAREESPEAGGPPVQVEGPGCWTEWSWSKRRARSRSLRRLGLMRP